MEKASIISAIQRTTWCDVAATVTVVGTTAVHYVTDFQEYLYTNFEPFEAHRLLPCFDQPNIKVRPLRLCSERRYRRCRAIDARMEIAPETATSMQTRIYAQKHKHQPTHAWHPWKWILGMLCTGAVLTRAGQVQRVGTGARGLEGHLQRAAHRRGHEAERRTN
jgi:hypothetical protein